MTNSTVPHLPSAFRQVGDNRVRETIGVCLNDLTVGLVIEHRPRRTVTEVDHALTLALTGNPAPIHSDVEYCRQVGPGRPLVCGIVTLGLVVGMTVRSTSAMTAANLSLDMVRFTHPVFVGDTLSATTTILTARPTRSNPDRGIVTCAVAGFNQDGTTVITLERTFFVPADAQTARDATDY